MQRPRERTRTRARARRAIVRITTAVFVTALVVNIAPPAHAHDVGAPYQAVEVRRQTVSPWYWCLYGENHLWESAPNVTTYASGTFSRSGPYCSNVEISSSIGVDKQLRYWRNGWPTECTYMWGIYASDTDRIGSTWSSFPTNQPRCGSGTYTVRSMHTMRGEASVPSSSVGWTLLESNGHHF